VEINGETVIAAPVQQVWDGLNSTEALAAAIPGCQSISESGENTFDVVAKVAVGPVKATFRAALELTDIEPLQGYVINFKSNGGVAGMASGKARVALSEAGEDTRLAYQTDVQVGGKLAQMGSRLIQSSADKLSAQFFGEFSNYLATGEEQPQQQDAVLAAKPGEQPAAASAPAGLGDMPVAPAMNITIELSTFGVGVLMLVIGFGLGYLVGS